MIFSIEHRGRYYDGLNIHCGDLDICQLEEVIYYIFTDD